MNTLEQLAKVTNPDLVRAYGAIRRFVITLTETARWQLAGVLMPDGREVIRAELFGGAGFYARPSSSGAPEAITVMVGGATNPMIIAVRDEKTRAAIIKALGGEPAPDTTLVHNSVAVLLMNPDGSIEARSPSGVAVPLMTKADGDAIQGDLHHHTHPAGTLAAPSGGGAVTGVTGAGPSVTAPVGTQKFRGE